MNKTMMQNIDFKQLALSVCQVARQAGDYIRGERANFSVDKVERKHAHDYVSYVDKSSEKMIVKALRELLPEAGFITEEGTTKTDSSAAADEASEFTWVVDPLDGTTHFIHGFPPYALA